MALEAEPIVLCDLLLEQLERRRMELNELTAASADEVIVMIASKGALITLSLSKPRRSLSNQPCLHKERYRSIDRRRMRVAQSPRAKDTRQVFDGEMALVAKSTARDALAHLRVLELLLSNEFTETRKRPLVVVGVRLGSDHLRG